MPDDVFALGQKQTFEGRSGMSALGQKRTSECPSGMSALPPKADIFGGRLLPLRPRGAYAALIFFDIFSREPEQALELRPRLDFLIYFD